MKYIIHIGLHKTGSTSIQTFLQHNIAALRTNRIDFYQGMVYPENHVELHAASMRPNRASGYKSRAGLKVDAAYISSVRASVADFVAQSPCEQILFSSEGISLLRFPDEMQMLKSLLPPGEIDIIVYLRNPADYLRSYAAQLNKDPETLPPTIDRDSYAYCKADSWLADYDQRLGAFEAAFGKDRITVIDYDRQVANKKSVLPSFLNILGMAEEFEEGAYESYYLNQTGKK